MIEIELLMVSRETYKENRLRNRQHMSFFGHLHPGALTLKLQQLFRRQNFTYPDLLKLQITE